MGLFDKWRERKRREKAAENGKSTNMWKRMFDRKKTRRKKKNESGTMGKPEVNMWGEPINPNYPKKTKQIIKNITTNKYDEIARKKYNKDYKDLNKFYLYLFLFIQNLNHQYYYHLILILNYNHK